MNIRGDQLLSPHSNNFLGIVLNLVFSAYCGLWCSRYTVNTNLASPHPCQIYIAFPATFLCVDLHKELLGCTSTVAIT